MECPHCKQEISTTVLAAHMGREGGSRASAAKKLSSRENGRLGGRPKKRAKHSEPRKTPDVKAVSDYWALRFYAEHGGRYPTSTELRKYKTTLTK